VLEVLNNLWGARSQVGIGLLYRPARLHGLVEFVPWNRILGSLKFKYSALCQTGFMEKERKEMSNITVLYLFSKSHANCKA
jgi:hypothetical protein